LDGASAVAESSHPLIVALDEAASIGVPRASFRDYCIVKQPPLRDAPPAEWDTWTDELVRWADQLRAVPSSWLSGAWCFGRCFGRNRAQRRHSKGCSIPETALRGISLAQLRAIYSEACELCAAEGWRAFNPKTKEWDGTILAPADINLYVLDHYYIRPQTAARQCSMVELIADCAQPP
jgi:hypothetical protein